MRKLYAAANLPEAYLIVQRLAQAGIDARVFNEHAQGGLGEIPFIHTYPEVWVLADGDWSAARGIVAQYESAPDAAPRACPACGESNPGEFELCWRCGVALG